MEDTLRQKAEVLLNERIKEYNSKARDLDKFLLSKKETFLFTQFALDFHKELSSTSVGLRWVKADLKNRKNLPPIEEDVFIKIIGDDGLFNKGIGRLDMYEFRQRIRWQGKDNGGLMLDFIQSLEWLQEYPTSVGEEIIEPAKSPDEDSVASHSCTSTNLLDK